MRYIDYGLSVLSAAVVSTYRPSTAWDLAGLISLLAARGQLAAYEAHRRFYEIGSPLGLEETDRFLSGPPKTA